MSSVDDRIVNMDFNSSTFMRGATQVLGMLDKLKSAVNFSSSSKNGIEAIQDSASRFSLAGMQNGIQGVSAKFLALSTVAITALANITNRAVDAGLTFLKSFTVGPIIDGLHEYETNLKSTQTIQANTDQPLTKVNASLDELNKYSDQTIYNFSEMAKNVGTFTAAGVDLETSVSSIKGIANLAALSGSSSQQASTAMYQLSQAIASGKVSLQDWNSVVNAGMGGKKLQNALAQTAVAMGAIDSQAVKMEGPMGKLTIKGQSFRESIMSKPGETPWLSSDILVNTLATMDGRFSAVALAAEKTDTGLQKYSKAQIQARIETARTALEQKNGVKYTDEQFKALQKMSTQAFKSATEVKTLGQGFDVVRESIGSGWAASFRNIFGDLNQAKKLFTGMTTAFTDIISANALARNMVLEAWSTGGGRTAVIEGIKNAWQALLALAAPIQEAFREIFPAKTGADLIALSQAFESFTQKLIIGGSTADKVKRTFAGIFAIFSIGVSIIKGVFTALGEVFGVIAQGSGGFLSVTASIGDFLVALDKSIKSGEGFTAFFRGIGRVLAFPLQVISALTGGLFNLVGGFGAAEGGAARVANRLGPIESIINGVKTAISNIGEAFNNLADYLAPVAPAIAQVFAGLGDVLAGGVSSGDYSGLFDAINSVLLGGILYVLKNFLKDGSIGIDFSNGVFANIAGSFEALTGSLTAMQTQVRAKTLLTIAAAVALLTVSIVALSLIDSAKLTKAMTAITAGFGQLLAAMAVLIKISGSAGFVRVPLIAASLVLLAGSILVLSAAVVVLSTLSWSELLKGLIGVSVLLAGLAVAAQFMSAASGGMLRAGIAMVPLSVGILLLAGAVKIFSTLSLTEMATGLAGVAGSLAIVAFAMKLMPLTLPITAAGLVLVALALNGIAVSMKIFASMSWEEMGKGLVGVGGALLLIAEAMLAMPITLPIIAAGLLLVAIALTSIAAVSLVFASMSWEEMGKAAAALAGALLIIAGGLFLMSGSLLGSAALLVAAGALAVLTPILITLGTLSISTIATGLGALAAMFLVLGAAGLLLAPIVIPLIGLGVALTAIGLGVALAGAGILALASAFAIFSAAGTAGILVVGGLIALLPKFITAFAKGVVSFAVTLGRSAGQFAGAFFKIIGAILSEIGKALPKIAALFVQIISKALSVIKATFPQFVSVGIAMLLALINGISQKIGAIVAKASDLIVKFLAALATQATKLVNAGINFIIKLVDGVAQGINENSAELGAAGGRLGAAIVSGMIKGIGSGIGAIAGAAKNAAKSALDAAKNILDINSPSKEFIKIGKSIHEGFVIGLVGSLAQTRGAIAKFRGELKAGITSAKETISSEKAKLDKLLNAKKKNPKAIREARKTIKQAEKEQKALLSGQKTFNAQLKLRGKSVETLAKQYDKVTAQLDASKTALADAVKLRDDYNKSTTDQYSKLPDIEKSTGVSAYLRNLTKSTEQTVAFTKTLAQLRAQGLNDTTYMQLLSEGLDAAPFAQKLLSGGKASVNEVNRLTGNLEKAAGTLGAQSSTALYQAGVNSAQGLVDGLASQQTKVANQMRGLAQIMVKAIKKSLKIKSPSQVFAEVGKYSSLGVAEGLKTYSGVAEKAAQDVGDNSLSVLKASMAKLNESLNVSGDFNPSVTPVLDLTQLQRDATKMSSLLDVAPIKTDVSYNQASGISKANQAAKKSQEAQAPVSVQPVGDTIKFEQTNISPKALSPIDIYRQTHNQISFAKEALERK